MIKNSKRGITIISLVVYLILFTTFTIFVANISSNMNENLFSERATAINVTSLNKLEYNIQNSAFESNNLTTTANTLTFSNADVYSYDSDKKIVYKNNGILLENIAKFEVTYSTENNIDKAVINIIFNKYLKSLKRTIVVSVEGV